MRKIDRSPRSIAAADQSSAHPLLILLVVTLITLLGIVEADLHRETLRSFHVNISGESVEGQFVSP